VYSLQLSPFSLGPLAYSLQLTAFSLQPSAYSLQLIAFSLQPSAFSLQPSAFSLQYCRPIREEHSCICSALIGPLEGEDDDGKLPPVDHGRRTYRGRDKKETEF
jgi:hypothetical protein